jgi:hypothetical protein
MITVPLDVMVVGCSSVVVVVVDSVTMVVCLKVREGWLRIAGDHLRLDPRSESH